MLGFKKDKKAKPTKPERISGRWANMIIWLKRFGMGLAVIVALIWGAAWLWLSGTVHSAAAWAEQETYAYTKEMGFEVKNIMVEGRVNADPDILLGLINMQEGDPLFAFNPTEARDLIKRVSWIQSVSVERRLPDTIYVQIKEREPLALYHNGEKLVVLDQEGEAITDYNLNRFKDLVLVSGKEGALQAPKLIRALKAEETLYPLIESASYISQRRWDIKMKNGVVVELPEDEMTLALSRLARAQKQDAILDKKIKAIDLRMPDRMIIQTYPGDVQDYKVNYNYGNNSVSSHL